MDIRDKVVVITGAGSGIGAAMARRFALEQAKAVVVADIDGNAAQAVAADIGGLAAAVDVADESQLVQLIDLAESRFGPIDLFCSDAGISVSGGPDVPDESWHRVWDVNLMAHVHVARALVPRMLERGAGYLLQTASAAGLLSQFDAPYAVTKHAAVAFAEWLSITYGNRGIKVSCLCPLGVDTPLFRSETAERRALMSTNVLSADEVASAVVAGLQTEEFLILPHPEVLDFLQRKVLERERWLKGMRRVHAQALNDAPMP